MDDMSWPVTPSIVSAPMKCQDHTSEVAVSLREIWNVCWFCKHIFGTLEHSGFIIFRWEFGRPGSQWMVSVIYCTMTVRLTLLQCDKWLHLQEILNRCSVSPFSGRITPLRATDWSSGSRDTVASLCRPSVQARSTAVVIFVSHQGTFSSNKCLEGTRWLWTECLSCMSGVTSCFSYSLCKVIRPRRN